MEIQYFGTTTERIYFEIRCNGKHVDGYDTFLSRKQAIKELSALKDKYQDNNFTLVEITERVFE